MGPAAWRSAALALTSASVARASVYQRCRLSRRRVGRAWWSNVSGGGIQWSRRSKQLKSAATTYHNGCKRYTPRAHANHERPPQRKGLQERAGGPPHRERKRVRSSQRLCNLGHSAHDFTNPKIKERRRKRVGRQLRGHEGVSGSCEGDAGPVGGGDRDAAERDDQAELANRCAAMATMAR